MNTPLTSLPTAEQTGMNTRSHNNGGPRILKFQFRWEIHRVDHNTIEVHVPTGGSQPIINPRWVEMMNMSDAQVEKHELAILRDVAILPE